MQSEFYTIHLFVKLQFQLWEAIFALILLSAAFELR